MRFRRNGQGTSPARESRAARIVAAIAVAVAVAGTAAGVGAADVHFRGGHRSTATPAARSAARRGAHSSGRAAAAGSPAGRLRTSCTSVAHIGDSTSVDLISPSFLPDPAQRLQARYAAVGVRHLRVDASGGRSIVEALPGQVNGYNVARAWRTGGFRGCWVFALGTNDTANVAAGSSVSMMARINEMMSVAHGQPVMWVNTRTMLSSGDWSNANEQRWNKLLVKALGRYPNMRVFNWSAVARPNWFLPDGIHYDQLGCAIRAKAIANALARAFPQKGDSKGQIVR